jgi:hypothetical protein
MPDKGRRNTGSGDAGMQTQAGGSIDVAFGYLTAIDSAEHGLFGGYLLVDGAGRPLEFHCTAPLKVSRAQQILYGPTLSAHVHGQQIGGTLLAAAGIEPDVVLTDTRALLHVRQHTRLPVALVTRVAAEDAGAAFETNDVMTDVTTDFVIGNARLSPPPGDAESVAAVAWREGLVALASAVELCEPFERIRLAIDEAQRS